MFETCFIAEFSYVIAMLVRRVMPRLQLGQRALSSRSAGQDVYIVGVARTPMGSFRWRIYPLFFGDFCTYCSNQKLAQVFGWIHAHLRWTRPLKVLIYLVIRIFGM